LVPVPVLVLVPVLVPELVVFAYLAEIGVLVAAPVAASLDRPLERD
jgi:hypothetical protein